MEDFTIDPLEEYLIGSTREGLRIYSLKDLKLEKELKALISFMEALKNGWMD